MNQNVESFYNLISSGNISFIDDGYGFDHPEPYVILHSGKHLTSLTGCLLYKAFFDFHGTEFFDQSMEMVGDLYKLYNIAGGTSDMEPGSELSLGRENRPQEDSGDDAGEDSGDDLSDYVKEFSLRYTTLRNDLLQTIANSQKYYVVTLPVFGKHIYKTPLGVDPDTTDEFCNPTKGDCGFTKHPDLSKVCYIEQVHEAYIKATLEALALTP